MAGRKVDLTTLGERVTVEPASVEAEGAAKNRSARRQVSRPVPKGRRECGPPGKYCFQVRLGPHLDSWVRALLVVVRSRNRHAKERRWAGQGTARVA